MNPKIRKTDALFSKLIREERPLCEMCRRRASSQIHHYFGRRFENVRFDDENVVAVCFSCHRVFHEDVEKGRLFMFQKLGQRVLDLLTLKRNLYKKRDDKLDMLWLKERIKNGKREI